VRTCCPCLSPIQTKTKIQVIKPGFYVKFFCCFSWFFSPTASLPDGSQVGASSGLATAQAAKRAKEVGIKKISGSSKETILN